MMSTLTLVRRYTTSTSTLLFKIWASCSSAPEHVNIRVNASLLVPYLTELRYPCIVDYPSFSSRLEERRNACYRTRLRHHTRL